MEDLSKADLKTSRHQRNRLGKYIPGFLDFLTLGIMVTCVYVGADVLRQNNRDRLEIEGIIYEQLVQRDLEGLSFSYAIDRSLCPLEYDVSKVVSVSKMREDLGSYCVQMSASVEQPWYDFVGNVAFDVVSVSSL
ncbi:hypothetical protein CL616_02945 [archaeon]|nr:hypothetical protein [archaeon]|tara:strand:- start:225 stop:629 length:405 start_codon:yes stop_codon:yes gene_type:complete